MSLAFKHPEFLWLLLCIAIPIIIHLFSFRKHKKIYFHNIQFIKAIQIEQSSTKSKLKELLILIMRIGIICFLVITFAQPYIPQNINSIHKDNSAVAIYIDNSFSTQAESPNGIVLEYEKKKAQLITDAYPAETKFFLFSNTSTSMEQIARTREEVKLAITEINPSPFAVSLSDISKKIQNCASKNETYIYCHILSDLQKKSFDMENLVNDSLISYVFHPVENNVVNNISIDSCFFESQNHILGQKEKLIVVIRNNSTEVVSNFPIKLFINDTLKAIGSTTLNPNSTSSIPIEYTATSTGIISGRLEIEDYPILYDNTYFFSYSINNQISIVDIYDKEPNVHIASLCKNQSCFSITNQSFKTIDYSTLIDYSVILLDNLPSIPTGLVEELDKLKNIGKNIVCIPSDNIDIDSYNNFLNTFGKQQFTVKDSTETKIEKIDIQNSVFRNVFENIQQNATYPKVKIYYQTISGNNNSLILLQNTQPFLSQTTREHNTLFMFSSPLSAKGGDFISSPLFVVLYNIFSFVHSSNNIQTTIGNQNEIFIPDFLNETAIHLENKKNNTDVIPQYRTNQQSAKIIINALQQITSSGNYKITQNKKPIAEISYNYDRKESDLEFYTQEDLDSFVSNLSNASIISTENNISLQINKLNDDILLWRISLLICILCLLIEVLIIRFYDSVVLRK